MLQAGFQARHSPFSSFETELATAGHSSVASPRLLPERMGAVSCHLSAVLVHDHHSSIVPEFLMGRWRQAKSNRSLKAGVSAFDASSAAVGRVCLLPLQPGRRGSFGCGRRAVGDVEEHGVPFQFHCSTRLMDRCRSTPLLKFFLTHTALVFPASWEGEAEG